MSAEDFRMWLGLMRLNDAAATRALGLGSRNTVAKYKREGAPLHVALACSAIAFGLPPFGRPPPPAAEPT